MRSAQPNDDDALAPACDVFFIPALLLSVTFFREPSLPSVPYSSELIASRADDGQSTAVLYFGRWAISADPKGGLLTPAVTRTLADANYAVMWADLTDDPGPVFRKLSRQGVTKLPVLALYHPTDPDAPVYFEGISAESQIIAQVERMDRR